LEQRKTLLDSGHPKEESRGEQRPVLVFKAADITAENKKKPKVSRKASTKGFSRVQRRTDRESDKKRILKVSIDYGLKG